MVCHSENNQTMFFHKATLSCGQLFDFYYFLITDANKNSLTCSCWRGRNSSVRPGQRLCLGGATEMLKGSQLLESNDTVTKQDVSGMQTRPPDEQHPESTLTRGDGDVTSPKMHRVTGCVTEKRLLFCRWRDGSLERGRKTGRASTRRLLDKRDCFHLEGTECFLPRAHGSRRRLKSDQEVKQQEEEEEQVTLWCLSLQVCPPGDSLKGQSGA